MTAELAPVRRLLTANDAQGRSYIAEDGPSPARLTMPGRTGYCNTNLWRTIGSPAEIDAPDSVLEHKGVMPPPGGTVLRVIDFPPEIADPEQRARATAETFQQMFGDAAHRPDQRHPGMHVTQTIDYAIVLHGEIYAVMDEDETRMTAGDVLIQRGTNHAWSNRSGAIARVAFILVDARHQ